MSEPLNLIAANIFNGDVDTVTSLIKDELQKGTPPEDILHAGLMAGMERVGNDFKCGDLYVPEVLIAARAMHAGMELLRPHLSQTSAAYSGKFVIGTVKGDLHDIGKSLVKLMLEGAGFIGIDLGTDVSAEAFMNSVRENKPDIVAMSALLTTTMTEMKNIIEALEDSNLRQSIKILVGGAPVTLAYAKEIGADGYAPDAARAVDVAHSLVGKR
jgi:5-methyltetrahydrofolate--homocysteine methyltransferase